MAKIRTGPPASGGGSQRLSVPVANQNADAPTIDTTTYANTLIGGGAKLTTLVFGASGDAAGSVFAVAVQGDAFPRWVFTVDPNDLGLCLGNGVMNPVAGGVSVAYNGGSNATAELYVGARIRTNKLTANLVDASDSGVIVPTEDPHIVGALWNNLGVATFSAG